MRHNLQPFLSRIISISFRDLIPSKNFSFIIILSFLVIPWTNTIAGGKRSATSMEFQFQTIDGESVHSGELANKVVLLDFWDTHSMPSMQLMPEMAALEEYFNMNLDVAIIAVNVGRDSFDAVKSFVKNTTHNLHFVYDKDSTITKAMGVEELPSVVIIDKDFQFHTIHMTYTPGNEKELIAEYKRMIEELL